MYPMMQSPWTGKKKRQHHEHAYATADMVWFRNLMMMSVSCKTATPWGLPSATVDQMDYLLAHCLRLINVYVLLEGITRKVTVFGLE